MVKNFYQKDTSGNLHFTSITE